MCKSWASSACRWPAREAFLRRVSAHMPVCLVTNGFADVQRPRIQGSPLRSILTGCTISEEYPHPKPHPEMLLRAMKRNRVDDPARVVMIGDNEDADILAAVNAGVQSVLYTRGRAPGDPVPRHVYGRYARRRGGLDFAPLTETPGGGMPNGDP